jgi:hypothetical protein
MKGAMMNLKLRNLLIPKTMGLSNGWPRVVELSSRIVAAQGVEVSSSLLIQESHVCSGSSKVNFISVEPFHSHRTNFYPTDHHLLGIFHATMDNSF